MPGRRVTPPALATLLDREVDALDRLVASVRLGVTSAARFDELEERAQGIGRRIARAFRTRSA